MPLTKIEFLTAYFISFAVLAILVISLLCAYCCMEKATKLRNHLRKRQFRLRSVPQRFVPVKASNSQELLTIHVLSTEMSMGAS